MEPEAFLEAVQHASTTIGTQLEQDLVRNANRLSPHTRQRIADVLADGDVTLLLELFERTKENDALNDITGELGL